jgi:hypothetical protein
MTRDDFCDLCGGPCEEGRVLYAHFPPKCRMCGRLFATNWRQVGGPLKPGEIPWSGLYEMENMAGVCAGCRPYRNQREGSPCL